MNVKDFRKCFSKGSVATNGRIITVFYTGGDTCVSQEITGGSVREFAGILRECVGVKIRREPGRFIALSFILPVGEDYGVALYDSLDDGVSEEYVADSEIRDISPNAEHDKFFADVDINNEDDVVERMNEWVSLKIEEASGNIIPFVNPIEWENKQREADELALLLGCSVECNKPSSIYGGDFEFMFSDESKSCSTLYENNIGKLIDFIEMFSGIALEVIVDNGYLNIILFV